MTSPSPRPALSTREFIALFALMMSLTAMSIDAILPALPAIATDLAIDDANSVQLTISMLIFGMAFGEILFGPLSDAIGRKKAIYLGIAIYCLGSLLAIFAHSLEMLLLGRVVQGLGVSGPKIASRALIRDQFSGNAMARITSFIMVVFILTPMLAPAIGQAILWIGSWRSIFLAFLLMALVACLWMGIRQPETLAKERRIALSPAKLLESSKLILCHARVMAYTLTAGVVFGTLLTFIATSQAMFADLYQIEAEFPLYFALLAFGAGLAALTNGRLVMRLGMQRLTLCALGGMLLMGSLYLLICWLYQGRPPLLLFMLCSFVLFFCHGMVFGNINALGMQYLGRVAGIGSSIMSSLSSLVAVAYSIPFGRLYQASAYHIPLSYMLGGLLGLLLVLGVRQRHENAV
ncbi:multidrug effflux MFS transporter [Balneatrix alpica]|uniref:multidrug effflux MFS transporter n=1 Tax=Balneatrix alpica TaxID=75684 RepID=UPI002739AA53|nr:multidrug effflux MFS transporter [Balneatrix alpica]